MRHHMLSRRYLASFGKAKEIISTLSFNTIARSDDY